jgi:MFS family permease
LRPYYGWVIVAAALMGMLIQGVIQAHSANVFLKPMTDDLGWSRTDFTWAQTVGVALMGFGGFFVGGMLDKHGPRRLMLTGALFASFSVAAQSQVNELWQYFLLRGVGVTIGSLLIGNLVVNVTVSKWFVRNRGWAIAFATTGISLGGIFLPPILARLSKYTAGAHRGSCSVSRCWRCSYPPRWSCGGDPRTTGSCRTAIAPKGLQG